MTTGMPSGTPGSEPEPTSPTAGRPLPAPMAIPDAPAGLESFDLGRIGYDDGLALQRRLQETQINDRGSSDRIGRILFLEHDPAVITVSRRPGAGAHVLASDEVLARHGVQRRETDRGGDVTWHGPGQLVAYPIVDLDRIGLRIHGWIRLLEQAIIDTLAELGIDSGRDPGATGVWVGRRAEDPDGAGGRKIAALGVRVSRWMTMHGLALNVDPDLASFELIVPCGLAGRPVTSIAREVEGPGIAMSEVKRRLARRLVEGIAEASRQA